MEIVFNIDNGFIPHLGVTILSILDNNKDIEINFHVLTYELSQENRDYVTNLVKNNCSKITFYDVDLELFKDFPIGKNTANRELTYTTYLRLLIAEVLPLNISKVLYLDSDIVVINQLKELWELDISEYYLAAVSESDTFAKNRIFCLGLNEHYGYFNAGVLLLNLDMIRPLNFFYKAKEYAINHFDIIKFHDQDILNALLYRKRLPIEERWNMMSNTDDKVRYTIIHFAWIKPWNCECKHPLKPLYYHYLNLTKWSGTPEVHRYSIWEKIKMKLAIRTRLKLHKSNILKSI